MAKKATSGLTLIEILVTVFILAMLLGVVYSLLFSSFEARDQVEASMRIERLGARILDVMASDLRATIAYHTEGTVFLAKSGNNLALETRFLTSTPSVLPDQDRYSPVNEVGYLLDKNGERPGFYNLVRSEDFFIDEEPTGGGNSIVVYDLVRELKMDFYGEEGEPPTQDWEVQSDEDAFPRRVAIHLLLGVDINPQKPAPLDEVPFFRFKTVVSLASEARETSQEDDEEGSSSGGSSSGAEVLGPEDAEGQ